MWEAASKGRLQEELLIKSTTLFLNREHKFRHYIIPTMLLTMLLIELL